MKHFRLPSLLICTFLLVQCGAKTPPASPNANAPTVMTKAELETKAAAGDASAQFELGALYHDGTGAEKDFTKAFEWFDKAAAQGEVRAQFNLGVMYYMGEGRKQDYAKAKEWFQRAADKGNARAQFNLGVMYYQGEGEAKDFAKALSLFTKAAEQNFNEAQFNLGVMYAKGEGLELDIGRAYAWFTAAKLNGNERAAEVLKTIERGLKPDELTIAKSLAAELQAKLAERQQQ